MASYEEALAVTVEMLKKRVPPGRSIGPKDAILKDLALDSLAVMELVADLEERLQITIPNRVLDEVVTVEDVARAVTKL